MGVRFAESVRPPRVPSQDGCENFTGMPAAPATVLLIEDDTTVAHIFSLSLERAGYRVVVATDGADGLEKARNDSPDLIFLDIRMPRMDGMEVLRALVSDAATRDVPVVMMSNFDDPALVRETARLGARDYMVKVGVNPAELGDIVQRWLSTG